MLPNNYVYIAALQYGWRTAGIPLLSRCIHTYIVYCRTNIYVLPPHNIADALHVYRCMYISIIKVPPCNIAVFEDSARVRLPAPPPHLLDPSSALSFSLSNYSRERLQCLWPAYGTTRGEREWDREKEKKRNRETGICSLRYTHRVICGFRV